VEADVGGVLLLTESWDVRAHLMEQTTQKKVFHTDTYSSTNETDPCPGGVPAPSTNNTTCLQAGKGKLKAFLQSICMRKCVPEAAFPHQSLL